MRLQSTDELFVHASPRSIIEAITRLSMDASWWPAARVKGGYGWVHVRAPSGRGLGRVGFRAEISPVREWEGFTWTLTDGEVVGRAEWWIEAFKDGAIVHHYLDAERGPRGRWRRSPTVLRRYRWALRRGLNGLKDALETGALPAGEQSR